LQFKLHFFGEPGYFLTCREKKDGKKLLGYTGVAKKFDWRAQMEKFCEDNLVMFFDHVKTMMSLK